MDDHYNDHDGVRGGAPNSLEMPNVIGGGPIQNDDDHIVLQRKQRL